VSLCVFRAPLIGITYDDFRRWSRNIKKGTKPEDIATQAEVDEIQLLLMETINQTESDLENKILLIIKNTQHLQDCTKKCFRCDCF
jgi:hypothetical protein